MKIYNVEIPENVKTVLSQGRIESNLYFLPQIQLDRKEYVEVNKILELIGGKWNRSKKAHVFDSYEKASLVMAALDTGSVVDTKKTYQFFETPRVVALKMIELADIKDGMTVLEPSAGHGAIIDVIPRGYDIGCVLCEIDSEKCKVLKEKYGSLVVNEDFLGSFASQYGKFDRIVMNPPFTKGQDAEHIIHAFNECLEEGGRLVSVASASVTFNSQKKYKLLRDIIEKHGEIIELPKDSFKESGTGVSTVLIVLNK